MHRVLSDNRLNRLHIILSARIKEEDAILVSATVLREASKLRPGFDVLTDLRHFRMTDSASGPLLEKVMRVLQNIGVRRVARVVGHSREGLVLFAQFSRGIEGYPVRYFSVLEDALTFLSSPPGDDINPKSVVA